MKAILLLIALKSGSLWPPMEMPAETCERIKAMILAPAPMGMPALTGDAQQDFTIARRWEDETVKALTRGEAVIVECLPVE